MFHYKNTTIKVDLACSLAIPKENKTKFIRICCVEVDKKNRKAEVVLKKRSRENHFEAFFHALSQAL